jgi:dolichol kinase
MDGFNFNRKLFHLIGFFVPGILYFDLFKDTFPLKYSSRFIVLSLVFVILLIMSVLEYIRLNHPGFNEFYLKNFGKIMKEAEKTRMNGVIPYMLSNAFIVSFFPSQVIFLSMAYLLIGDPVAAYYGSKYGKYRFSNGKSLVGVVAFIIASTLSGLFLMYLFQSTYQESLLALYRQSDVNYSGICIVFIGAVVAGIAEFLSGHAWKGFLEDNLLIPVVSSLTLTVLLVGFGHSTFNEIIFPIIEILTHI